MKYVIFQIKISLLHSDPPIWRRILVHKNELLSDFHELIQGVMGWEFAHLHGFRARQNRGKKRQSELLPVKNEDRTRLKNVLLKPNDRILYEYDFGDGWTHDVVLEKVHAIDSDQLYPWILDGSGACPPEDSGGIPGYSWKLVAFSDPKREDHEEIKEWLGEDFDPEFFDPGVFNDWQIQVHQKLTGTGADRGSDDHDADSRYDNKDRDQVGGESAESDDDIDLTYSMLGRTVEHDEYTLEVNIYRSDESDWILEVVNEEGTSIVWDDHFETDRLAFQEFERCLQEEGIEAFK